MGQGDSSKVRCWRLFIFVTLFCGVMGGIITDGQNDGPLHRAKRYARIPLAYMNKVNPALFEDSNNNFMYNTNAKRWLVDRRSEPKSAPSHFREFQLKQQNNNNNRNRLEATSAAQNPVLPARNTRLYQMTGAGSTSSSFSTGGGIRSGNTVVDLEDLPNQLSPLTDEELAKLLLLLDGFALGSKGGNPTISNSNDNGPSVIPEQYYNSNYLSPEDLRRAARMYTMGKRENEGRFLELEQPESLDNEGPNEPRLEFLTQKRSKRVGGSQNHKTMAKEANRMKKETDPKVIAQLQKVFENVEEPRALPASSSLVLPPKSTTSNGNNNEKSVTTDQSVSTSSSSLHQPKNSGSEQVHIPSMGNAGNNKAKKSIDWSNYFGIDKKNGESHHHDHKSSTATVSMANPQKLNSQQQEESTGSGTTNSPLVKAKAIVANRITQPTKTMKETKQQKKLRVREENETENKSDRKWILNEFYKNMAMSTNVKRKRDASRDEADELADLEHKMAAAGDDIIWDALKYTGAHKDEPLSPIELAQVKKTIIERLATAYNLEKIREAIDEFREQLLGVKTNNV